MKLINNYGAKLDVAYNKKKEPSVITQKIVSMESLRSVFHFSRIRKNCLAKEKFGRILQNGKQVSGRLGSARVVVTPATPVTIQYKKKTSKENIQVNCVHPGIVNTNIAQEHKGILQFIIKLVLNFKGISPAEGADTLVYLATNDTARNVSGKYFIKRKQTMPSKEALKHDVSVRLWQESIEILDRFFS